MQLRQQTWLVWLAFVLIAPAVALLLAYAVAAPIYAIHVQSLLGPSFYRIIEDFSALQIVFGPLGAFLIAGLSGCTGLAGGPLVFRTMAGILVVGLLSTLALVYFIAFSDVVGSFIALNSGWDIDPDAFRARAYPFLGWAIGALALGLGALFGVASKKGVSS